VVHFTTGREHKGVGVRRDRVRDQRVNINFGDKSLRFIKNMREFSKLFSGRVAVEFQTEKKFQLQSIHLRARDPSNTSVILVVEVDIVRILGSNQHRSDKQAVDGARVDKHRALVGGNAVQVNEGNDEGLDGARSVGNHSLNVLTNGDGGDTRGVEAGKRGIGVRGILGQQPLKSIGKGSDEGINGGVGESLHLHG